MTRADRTPNLAATALRWLVLLVIWFDLVGSPFHAHHHDIGPDSLPVATAATPQAAQTAEPELHAPGANAAGHSQAALRADNPRQPEPPLDALLAIGEFLLATEAVPHAAGWRPHEAEPAPAATRHERPAGRAPPLPA